MLCRTAARAMYGLGGIPFSGVGNIYNRPANPDDYKPERANYKHNPKGAGKGTLGSVASGTRFVDYNNNSKNQYMADDVNPSLQNTVDQCPYFALCDMAVWFGMDPAYLSPGLLNQEEHHLLLLHSRAYFEKWKAIHSSPREFMPHKRIKRGKSSLLHLVCHVSNASEFYDKLVENMVDDASLIAMKPTLWSSAYLEPRMRSQLTGTVLQQLGMPPEKQNMFHNTIDSMRCFRVNICRGAGRHLRHATKDAYVDEDIESDPHRAYDVVEERIVHFRDAITLYDLYEHIGIRDQYNGQIRVHNFGETRKMVSLRHEDDYFDFMYECFMEPDFVANPPIPGACSTRFELDVLPQTVSVSNTGVWF
eukprot:PhM_4_TR1387/c0_g1_i1/m.12781